MAVYILHFNESIGSVKKQSKHYCGFSDQPAKRMAKHWTSSNVPIVRAFRDKGIGFKVGKLWRDKDRTFERWVKNTNNIGDYCLICREEKIIKKQIGWVMTKYLWFMCGISKDGGKTIEGIPFVRDGKQLKATQERLKKQNNGEEVFVLTSATINQIDNHASIQQCAGINDYSCTNTAIRPTEHPQWCDKCYETQVEWAIEEEAEKQQAEAEESFYEKEAQKSGQIYSNDDEIPF